MSRHPIDIAIENAYRALSSADANRFPPYRKWEPEQAQVGTEKNEENQGVRVKVPTVPTVPTQIAYTWECAATCANSEAWVTWLERVAVLEIDGGFERSEAERLATQELGAP